MAPVPNGRYLFKEIPVGFPIPGQTTVYDESQTIDLHTVPLNGGFLVKVLVLSIDPYIRSKMRDPSIDSYTPAYFLNEPLYGYGLAVVLRSEDATLHPGDHIYGIHTFKHYSVKADASQYRVIKNEEKLPWSAYVGICGMAGETACYAWKEYARPQKGQVAFVTAGAGPVGATVIQLAKADGMKVIASAGSDDKVDFIKSVGADVAFNYKTERTADVLAKEGPVDVYWDNVGGETLEAAIEHSARYARFIECGMISAYNSSSSYHVKNLTKILSRELSINGFIVSSLRAKYVDAFYAEFPARVARGEIQYKEYPVRGLAEAGQAIADVQSGKNFGKCVLIVADD
ncbi:hypothetical protein GSI_05660 [Ganoderma sinense ZZ0214-1]|uniref:Enoyl reductase (ER) domain-containing protein n=1 Tax=Ganoderma sinense ZZ0214-1 TaxID=1077348 RepID=A0A2G8SF55_9APHY|nr:hypothetical protein GSI_05660 [Ganoderma sinense ZZ0214-1]